MSAVIKVNYDGKTRRYPYPTTPIKDFLEVLRIDFKINTSATLNLLDKDEELSASYSLDQLHVADSSELTLKLDKANNGFVIRVQTVSGQMFSFSFDDVTVLKDLYDRIQQEIESTTTYPLLFNHRMHIFNSIEFLKEPLIDFLLLTTITNENLPHFYLFEYDLAYRTRQYDYTKNLKDIFIKSDLWQPRSCQQTNEALLIYLNTMYALTRVFLTKKDVDYDSVHDVYMPHFLIALRRCLFPPACLAFKHAMEGALFNFEKSLLSEAFFYLFRKLLPPSILDADLFSYTPYVFCWIFGSCDRTSQENACYESVEFNKRTHNLAHSNTGEESISDEHFVKPVRLLNDKIVSGAANCFVLMEYKEVRDKSNLTQNDYQQQPDLVGLLMLLKRYNKVTTHDDPCVDTNFHEQFSTDYTFWMPNDNINLFPISNVTEQRETLKSLSENEVQYIKEQLSTNDLYSIFTFADPTALSKYNHAQMVLLKSGSIVYITNIVKNHDTLFQCFDPLNVQESVDKTEVATKDILVQRPNLVIRENAADIRKIEQITCILFDISGSMNTMVGIEDNKHTLLELSTMAFGAWRDRLVSYRLPYAVGLIYFGAEDEPCRDRSSRVSQKCPSRSKPTTTDSRVVIQCNLTRDFTHFEKALEKRPECGERTPLYDAVELAIEKIRSYREESKTRLSPTCRELILCLTDGDDNCSKASQSDVFKKLVSNKIVFDAISFERSPNDVLIRFCEATKGYYYRDIQHNQASMLNLFELEATISLQDREENAHGIVTRPQRRQSVYLAKPAVTTKQAKIGDGRASNISTRRVMLEIKNVNKSDLCNFELFVSKENILYWKVIMAGEDGTPYADGRWLLFIEFPPIYPEKPPEIRFITKIYHCNINDDGKICHEILSSSWSQKTSMYSVFMEILRLLREPNADDALSAIKGAQLKASKENYDNTIIEWKILYASASVDQLKEQYHLE